MTEFEEQGTVVSVSTRTAGSELVGDHASGATAIVVDDAYDFSEAGGSLQIGAEVYVYTDFDDDTGTITLNGATTAAYLSGERVIALPVSTEKVALVELTGGGDAIEALVKHNQRVYFPEGIRAPDARESVNLSFDGDQYLIENLNGMADVTTFDGEVRVVGGGTITTEDEITGAQMRLGEGQLKIWQDAINRPDAIGLLYCDVASGNNYLRMFPPHDSGSGLENSITIQGRRATDPGNLWLYTDGQLLLSSSGALLADAGKMQLTTGGEFGLYGLPTTGSAANLRLDTIGAVWTIGKVTSSRRYKQDIEDATIDPADVLNMQGRTWRDKSAVEVDPDTTQRHVGFIAEELDEIGLGVFVDYDEEGRPDAIQYDRVNVALVALAKTQQAQIDALTARLDALDGGAQ